MPAWLAVGLFVVGAGLAIWATERFLEGIVSLAARFRLSAFIIGAVLSGLEVENIAVGLAAGAGQVRPSRWEPSMEEPSFWSASRSASAR